MNDYKNYGSMSNADFSNVYSKYMDNQAKKKTQSSEEVADKYFKKELGVGLEKVMELLKESNPELFV